MKKIGSTILAVVMILITVILIVALLIKNGVINLIKEEPPKIMEYTTELGKVFTENTSIWEPCVVEKTPINLETPITQTKKVYLHLTNNDYYEIEIPSNYDYEWDYGKTVYGVNGEFVIRIVNNSDFNNIAELAGIEDAVSLNNFTITNNYIEEIPTYRILASLIGDTGYSVICEVYKGNDLFTSLCNSVTDGIDNLVSINFNNEISYLDDLPVYEGKFAERGLTSDFSLVTEKYKFADGDIYLRADVRPLSSITNEYITLLTLSSGDESVTGYYGKGFLYFESNNCYLGMYSYNSNTTEILIGKGEEAKCNILGVLNKLK